MLALSQPLQPAMLKGLLVQPDNPFELDFVIDEGGPKSDQQPTPGSASSDLEINKLIRYFLASLTVPEKDLWVNLSPYEKDRIIPDAFGLTEMGRDLLGQDYVLKQLTSSLMYPEKDLGKKFWDEVYRRSFKEYGTTSVPVDTFNKVWIVPDEAVVYEKGSRAFVVKARLKVMLESDYLAAKKTAERKDPRSAADSGNPDLARDVLRAVIIPVLEKDINEGANFVQLRQIYNAMILAAWFKTALKNSVLGQVYADKNKVNGVDLAGANDKQEIYERYLAAFKKGVYNYIKEEYDQYSQETIPRKYFSGGFDSAQLHEKVIGNLIHTLDAATFAGSVAGPIRDVRVRLTTNVEQGISADRAMATAVVLDRTKYYFDQKAIASRWNAMKTVLRDQSRKDVGIVKLRPSFSGEPDLDALLKIRSLVEKGQVFALDLSEFAKIKDPDTAIEQIQSACDYIWLSLSGHKMSSFMAMKELFKNALYHGNALRLDVPVFLYINAGKTRLAIFDLGLGEPEISPLKRAADKSYRLAGGGVGLGFVGMLGWEISSSTEVTDVQNQVIGFELVAEYQGPSHNESALLEQVQRESTTDWAMTGVIKDLGPIRPARINERNLEAWQNDLAGIPEDLRPIIAAVKRKGADYLRENGRISYERFVAALSVAVNEFNRTMDRNVPYAVFFDNETLRSSHWVYDIAGRVGLSRKPDVGAFWKNDGNGKSGIENIIKKGIHTYVLFDDAVYSGQQIEQKIDYILAHYQGMAHQPKFVVVTAYGSRAGEARLKDRFHDQVTLINNGVVTTWADILTDAEIQAAQKVYPVFHPDQVLNFFDHKQADVMSLGSFFQTVINVAPAPYGRVNFFFNQESREYSEYMRNGIIDYASGKKADRAMQSPGTNGNGIPLAERVNKLRETIAHEYADNGVVRISISDFWSVDGWSEALSRQAAEVFSGPKAKLIELDLTGLYQSGRDPYVTFGQWALQMTKYLNYYKKQDGQVLDLTVPLFELLKNAWVHGNLLKDDLPIYVYFDPQNNDLLVYDLDVSGEADETRTEAARVAGLWGAGAGIRRITKKGMAYAREGYPETGQNFGKVIRVYPQGQADQGTGDAKTVDRAQKMRDDLQRVTGKPIKDVDILRLAIDQDNTAFDQEMLRAIQVGQVVAVDLRGLSGVTKESMQTFKKGVDLLGDYVDIAFANKLQRPVEEENIPLALKEMFKNAIYHGNRMLLDLPIFLWFDKDRERIVVYDFGLYDVPVDQVSDAVARAGNIITGAGAGVSLIRDTLGWIYEDHQPVYSASSGSSQIIGAQVSIQLRALAFAQAQGAGQRGVSTALDRAMSVEVDRQSAEQVRGRLLSLAEVPNPGQKGAGDAIFDQYFVNKAKKYLATWKVTLNDLLPYQRIDAGLEPMVPEEPLPERFDGVPQLNVRMDHEGVLLVSRYHSGGKSMVRLGFLQEGGRPVVLKTPSVKELDKLGTTVEDYLLKEYRSFKLGEELGIGPKVFGVYKDADDGWCLVMDFVPGDFPKVSGHVGAVTVRDLREIRRRLYGRGLTFFNDFQFYVMPNGHIRSIDLIGLGTEEVSLEESEDTFYENLRDLLGAMPDGERGRALQEMSTEDPVLMDGFRQYLLDVPANQGINLELWRQVDALAGSVSGDADQAMKGKDEVGGIDLTPENLKLLIKRDGKGNLLPILPGQLEKFQVNGLVPVILNITPVEDLPKFLGMNDGPEQYPQPNA